MYAELIRVDLRDAADVIATALTDPSFPAGGYPLAGPANVSGAQAAATWSRALGRPVAYAGPDVDLAEVLGGELSGQKLADFRRSYRVPDAVQRADVTARRGDHHPAAGTSAPHVRGVRAGDAVRWSGSSTDGTAYP